MKEEIKKIIEFESGVRIVEVTEAMFEEHMEQEKHNWGTVKELRILLSYGKDGQFLGASTFDYKENRHFIPKTTEI